MSYRRFRLADVDLTSATVATTATVRVHVPKSVATVATVAAAGPEPDIVLSAYRRMLELCARGSAPRRIDIVERFLRRQFIDARRLGWGEADLFGCYPKPAFAAVRYDCMGAVTIAALTLVPIVSVTTSEVRGENGLASRRPLPCRSAKPVWLVFPDRPEDESR